MTEREFAKLEKDAVTSLARLLATPGLATEQATELARPACSVLWWKCARRFSR